ncbi:glycosyl transferase family 28 [Methanoplanus sp. FWC-SCC4]|uniref:Glycosyl transferase family 28 n=1 Tax=Methanochimaera problematica TaxID=2609417 RepID=A0AA97F9L1_9EURY|nr:glycosyltransferase family protein [Methanoplanus sp. FWC-SCC4]WOF15350.1 glycosyl transferase family 28 [Methanoplanus sp. FWC-SCC4]
MRILFVVCGEGLGHASRTSKLARYFERYGHKCYFASYGKAYDFIKKQDGYTSFETVREVSLEGDCGYFSLSKTLWSSKGVIVDLFRSFMHIKSLIRENSIDLLIADTMYASVGAAKMEGIPSLFITNQNKFASASDQDSAHWHALSNIVEKYLSLPDTVLVPDFAPPNSVSSYNLEIPPEDRSRYRFIGPIMDVEPSMYDVSSENIFASFGGEPFKLPLYEFLYEISKERPYHKFDVFSTTPGLPGETQNFITHGYVPDLLYFMSKSRLNILHGGLTSLHETLLFNKPCVMIIDPYHPEQWNNGRKIEEIGAGIMLPGNSVTKRKLSDAIDDALELKPPNMIDLFIKQDGKVNAMKVIDELL